jgi:hypothetical protein
MKTLPNELIKIILEDLDWKTILNVLEILNNLFLITDIIPLLSKKLKVTIYGPSFKEVKRECEKRNMIVLLNR